MKRVLLCSLFMLAFLLLAEATAISPDDAAAQEMITRLVANAAKTPPGPVEDDIAPGIVESVEVFRKNVKSKLSLRESLASDFNFFTLEGPLSSLYNNGEAALFTAPVKLTAETLKEPDDLPLNKDPGVMFGVDMGGWMYLDAKAKPDGKVIATFCFFKIKGAWKAHSTYISNAPLKADQTKALIHELDLYAKKS